MNYFQYYFQLIYTYKISTGISNILYYFKKRTYYYRINYPSPTLAIVNYTTPTGTSPINNKQFIWGYSTYVSASNTTNTAIIFLNEAFTQNLQIFNSTFSGNQAIKAINKKCMILNNTVSKEITFATLQDSFSNSSNVTVVYSN